MTNEERILERLEDLDAKVSMMHSRSDSMADLQQTLTPIMRDMLHNVLLKEFGDLQEHVEMADILALFKRFMKSVRDLTWMLETMENMIELWRTCEPMIKPTFLASIEKFDELEQKGVFKAAAAMGDSLSGITEKYTPEEIGNIGNALVNLAGLLERMGDADLDNAKPVSPLGMIGTLHTRESKQALGMMAELLTAMGKEKK